MPTYNVVVTLDVAIDGQGSRNGGAFRIDKTGFQDQWVQITYATNKSDKFVCQAAQLKALSIARKWFAQYHISGGTAVVTQCVVVGISP